MTTRDIAAETVRIGLSASPGAAGTTWTAVDGQVMLSIAVGALTGVLVVVQVAYAIWKWRRNSRLSGMIP